MQRFLEPRHEIPASAHASGHDEVIIRQLGAVAEAHSVGTWIEGGCGGLDVRDTSRQQWRQRAHAMLSVGEGSAHQRPQRLIVVRGRGIDDGDLARSSVARGNFVIDLVGYGQAS